MKKVHKIIGIDAYGQTIPVTNESFNTANQAHDYAKEHPDKFPHGFRVVMVNQFVESEVEEDLSRTAVEG